MSGDTLYITSSVALGTAVAYLLYQSHYITKKQQHLMIQNAILTDKVLRLESDVAHLKEKAVTDDDVFVDTSEFLEHSSDSDEAFVNIPKNETIPDIISSQQDPSENNFQSEIDRLDEQMDKGGIANIKESYETLLSLVNKYSKSCEIQWRLAKCGFLLGSEEDNENRSNVSDFHKQLMENSEKAAKVACEIDPCCGDAHKWAAIIIGSRSSLLSIADQLKSAHTIKEHISTAIKFKPKDALSYHILGRWCFSVSQLSWVERRLAAAIYAEPPTASIDEALENFLKAEEINPESSVENVLFLAKCYVTKKDYKLVAKWLSIGSSLKASSQDDQKALEEIQQLLPKYSSYL